MLVAADKNIISMCHTYLHSCMICKDQEETARERERGFKGGGGQCRDSGACVTFTTTFSLLFV